MKWDLFVYVGCACLLVKPGKICDFYDYDHIALNVHAIYKIYETRVVTDKVLS